MKFVTTGTGCVSAPENTWTVEIYAPTGECRETLTFGERSEAVAEAKIWVDVQTGRRAPA